MGLSSEEKKLLARITLAEGTRILARFFRDEQAGTPSPFAEALLERFASHHNLLFRKAAAKLSWRTDLLRRLAKDPVVDVREEVARNPLLPEEDQVALARDTRPEVVFALGKNPNLSPKAVEVFFHETVASYYEGDLAHLLALRRMAERVPEERFAEWVLLNPKVPPAKKLALMDGSFSMEIPTRALVEYLERGSWEGEVVRYPLHGPQTPFGEAYLLLAERGEGDAEEVLVKRWEEFAYRLPGSVEERVGKFLKRANSSTPLPLLERILREFPGVLRRHLDTMDEIPTAWQGILVKDPDFADAVVLKSRGEVLPEVQAEMAKGSMESALVKLASMGKLDESLAPEAFLLGGRLAYQVLRAYPLPEGREDVDLACLRLLEEEEDPRKLHLLLVRMPASALDKAPGESLRRALSIAVLSQDLSAKEVQELVEREEIFARIQERFAPEIMGL